MAIHKRRTSAGGEGHMDESWLIPYADLLTLLLALFVVLFASSVIDDDKMSEMQGIFENIFGMGSGEVILDEEGKPTGAMGNLYIAIDKYIVEHDLEEEIAVAWDGEHVLITLRNDFWFEPGRAEVTPQMRDQIPILAKLLSDNQNKASPFEVIVAGHTDSQPMMTPGYDNWDLSADRAIGFLKMLVKDTSTDLDISHFSARAYGQDKPIIDDSKIPDTDSAKKQEAYRVNRRVELLISQPKRQAKTLETPAPPPAEAA